MVLLCRRIGRVLAESTYVDKQFYKYNDKELYTENEIYYSLMVSEYLSKSKEGKVMQKIDEPQNSSFEFEGGCVTCFTVPFAAQIVFYTKQAGYNFLKRYNNLFNNRFK